MRPIRQLCQLELIVEFAEAKRSIVLVGTGKGPLGQQEAHKASEDMTTTLAGGRGLVNKTTENWKRVNSFYLRIIYIFLKQR